MPNPAQMAGGAPMPQQMPQMPSQGSQQAPTGAGNVQATPNQASVGDPTKILQALKGALSQVVDNKGYVDMNRLVTIWPQVAQQMGINVPFQTVLQLISQNPDLMDDIISQMGLAGIIVNGKMISAEELLAQSQSGASAATGSPAQQGAAATGH